MLEAEKQQCDVSRNLPQGCAPAEPIGLYLHVPFCAAKCAYCDFYSGFATDIMLDKYAERLAAEIKKWGGEIHRPINTVYFGGGTPSLLGGRIEPLMQAVRGSFELCGNAEITLEANPECFFGSRDTALPPLPGRASRVQPAGEQSDFPEFLSSALRAGVNRLSVGIQSGTDRELKTLGRRHTASEAEKAVSLARRAGFNNISLDLMIGLPGSDICSLRRSLDFLLGLAPEHISAYILKIEPNTALWRQNISLPDDDRTADQYLFACEYLENAGYRHYEISNFARPGFEGRHNLGYWNGGEYLGLGPSAHSFLNGRRFFYPRDLKAFLNCGVSDSVQSAESPKEPKFPQSISPLIISDGCGGSAEEYIMLRLRTSGGINFREYERRFKPLPKEFYEECRRLEKAGLMRVAKSSAALTDRGMLVSNSIIISLTERL